MKNKKRLFVCLLLILAIILVGCTTNENENNKKVANDGTVYEDGTYNAEGDPWEYGIESATVVIKDGKIESIELKRLDTEGNEINYEELQANGGPELLQSKENMANKMNEKQSSMVDNISGATVSADNWKLAVKRALEQASK